MEQSNLFTQLINIILKKKKLTFFVIILSFIIYPIIYGTYYKNLRTYKFNIELYEFYSLENEYFNYESFIYSLKTGIEESIASVQHFEINDFSCNKQIIFKIDCKIEYFVNSKINADKTIQEKLIFTYKRFFNKEKKKFTNLMERTQNNIDREFKQKEKLQKFYRDNRLEKDITADFYFFDSNTNQENRIYVLQDKLIKYTELVDHMNAKLSQLNETTVTFKPKILDFNLMTYASSIFVSMCLYIFIILFAIS